MDRIKTTGSSLKALWSKLKNLPLSYQIAGSAFLLATLFLNSLLMPGCLTKTGIGQIHQDHLLKEYEFENVRFEPLDSGANPLPIQPARAYWLKRGEKVAVRLDTFEIHWEHVGAMCSFINNTSAGDCQICDYCNPPPSFMGPPCFSVTILASVWFNIVADPGFIQTDNPKQIIEMNAGRILGACNRPPEAVPVFEPEASGLFRATPQLPSIIKGETDGEIKLHVIETGLAQKTPYQLTRQTVDNTNYWTWAIEGSPLWLENFSPNLRVTDIQILRGRCGDGSAQGKQCAVPNARVPVKPSRILFLPDFPDWGTVSQHPGESSHRCYSNPIASGDGFINLDSCRETFNASQTIQKPATPAYEASTAQTALERLTWLVEFNTTEGADADLRTPGLDPMPPDAELIIEFTIRAN